MGVAVHTKTCCCVVVLRASLLSFKCSAVIPCARAAMHSITCCFDRKLRTRICFGRKLRTRICFGRKLRSSSSSSVFWYMRSRVRSFFPVSAAYTRAAANVPLRSGAHAVCCSLHWHMQSISYGVCARARLASLLSFMCCNMCARPSLPRHASALLHALMASLLSFNRSAAQ